MKGSVFKKTTLTFIAIFGAIMLIGYAQSVTVITDYNVTTGSVIGNGNNLENTSSEIRVCTSTSSVTTGCDITGDGTADNVEIQQALNMNRNVKIMNGEYDIAATIQLKGNDVLSGEGNRTVLTCNGCTDVFDVDHTINEVNKRYIKVSDLSIIGDGTDTAFYLSGVQFSTFENIVNYGSNVTFYFTGNPLGTSQPVGENHLSHIIVNQGGTGVIFDGVSGNGQSNGNTIDGESIFKNMGAFGVDIKIGDSNVIKDTTFQTCGASCVRVDDALSTSIKDNYFEGATACYINLVHGDHTTRTDIGGNHWNAGSTYFCGVGKYTNIDQPGYYRILGTNQIQIKNDSTVGPRINFNSSYFGSIQTLDAAAAATDRMQFRAGSATTQIDITNAIMDFNTNYLYNIGSSDTDFDSVGNITIGALSGSGNAYACLDSNGKLFRKATACA